MRGKGKRERRGRAVKSLANKLETLGLNPMMFGYEVDDLDVSPEVARKYEEQRDDLRRAASSWLTND